LQTVWRHHWSNLHNRKKSISLKRKKIFQKEKRHFSVFWKAFQISTKRFSFHRHFKPQLKYFKYLRSHIIMPCKFEVDFRKIDSLLDIPSIVLINHHLPASQQHRWRLLFSTQIHGESFSAFIHQIANQGPVVIVVRDTSGHIFGGFASMSWTIKSHFVGGCTLYILSVTYK